jgi:Skp family chaperone for outer membrane proteins
MTFAAMVITASAAPRFAVIRVTEIYAALPSTAALQAEIKKEREDLMKNPRAEELRRIITELQGLQARLSDKANPLDEETSRKLARSYEIKRQEAQTLQNEFESFRTEQEKQINRKLVTGMRDALNRIMETSQKVAKEQGYDLVLDSSGSTNTGVPFVLHQKESPDLTDAVKAALQDAKPESTSKQP